METAEHIPVHESSTKTRRLAFWAIAVGVFVWVLKFAAYRTTGSVSLFSDALESVVNVLAAVGVYVAIRIAARPPDRNHPFGHAKAEYISSVVEGAFILFAAVEIVRTSVKRFASPMELADLSTGLALAGLATAVNAGLAITLIRAGRRQSSPALLADGRHLWADVLTTISVVAGILLARWTGWWILDPLLALVITVHILWVGADVLRESVGGLMDESLPEEVMQRLRVVIHQTMGKAVEVHDLRSRLAAGRPFVEFHLVVPGHVSVQESHDLCDRLEDAVEAELPRAQVLIHVEPEVKAKGEGRVSQVG